MPVSALDHFSEPARAWFETTFPKPTPPQEKGWPAIADGDHTLILAPTGSGKTLSAFFWGLDQLATAPVPDDEHRTRLLYISPLRALAVDIEKNLRAPLQGMRLAAERLGSEIHVPTVGVRTGDTSAAERRSLVRRPPDLLITTPESLYLMLTSKARETLENVEAVIIDEIHALAPTKRGAHMAVTLERLEAVADKPFQRIGLSATQRPLDEIARFLGGHAEGKPRPVTIVDAGVKKPLEVEVIVPVEDMAALGEIVDEPMSGPAAAGPVRRSIWPAMHPKLLELIQENRSTIVFVNARRLAERLATRLNELALEGENRSAEAEGVSPAEGQELVKAHHGSLSRTQRLQIEDELKRGTLKGLVATSSLELGIDMGAVDLVVQVESPGAVSRGLQRVGRAGHQVGQPSRGRLFPKHRADLLEAACVVERMHAGEIEHTYYLRNPLDVLAQHIVAMVALDDWSVTDLSLLIRRSATFADISDDQIHGVLDLLSGRYPSEEFGELRARIVWDRLAGVVSGRAGSQRLAVTSGGTIPDRGLYGVFLPDGTRVGELDEEMVYESRVGETFLLGATTWRIQDITHERVVVTPAPGEPGKMPFWHGDGPGRPLELGLALGEFTRELREADRPKALARLADGAGLDAWAAENLMQYLDEQADATGVVPDDRTIVVERFRDEIGDWRVCVHSPFGAQVHAPWAMALQSRLGAEWGLDVELMWSDDGIVLRLPEAIDDLPIDQLALDPDEVTEIIVSQLPSTAMFAARFRECAARALLLPRRRPDQRTPLWMQRQKAADLLAVAAKYPTFPILLETSRECLNDVFDLPALRQVLTDLRSRRIRMVAVETPRSSPFAQSLLFGWIAVYMYEGDAPLAERRAAALALDRDMLRDLLGAEELRELIDPGVLADLELELQRLVEHRHARDADELADLLRWLGPLSRHELEARTTADSPTVGQWLDGLAEQARVIEVTIAEERRWAAAEDAGKLRDAIGTALPMGLPAAFTDSVQDPLAELLARYARTHGPFTAAGPSARFGVGLDRTLGALGRLAEVDRVVVGEFRPGGVEREWCDRDVLQQLRRRSLSALRKEVEPVDTDALARFLPEWQAVVPAGERGPIGPDALAEIIGTLQGAPMPASVFEADILAARMPAMNPSDLDALCTSGEVVWAGAGSIGSTDGRIRLAFRDHAPLLIPEPDIEQFADQPVHVALLEHLEQRGASFWADLVAASQAAGQNYDEATVLAALWDLVWAGAITNDSLVAVRSFVGAKSTKKKKAAGRGRRGRPGRVNRLGPPSGAGRWSLVAPLLQPAATPTEVLHTRALQLLDRYGVVTRETALGEGAEGGFAGVYPVLKALEEQGQVRRGYFVVGLGAAQFAVPGAVDRIRSLRESAADSRDEDTPNPILLAATDPAQPFGAALPWPETPGRPARAAGAFVVLVDGAIVAYLERGGRSLVTFDATAEHPTWPAALRPLIDRRRLRSIEIAKIDGGPVNDSPVAEHLKANGFTQGYRGLVLR